MPDGNPEIPVGGIITGLIMASNMEAEEQDLAIKFVKAYIGPDYQVAKMERGDGLYAGNADYDKSKMNNITNELIEAFRNAPGYIPSMDAFAPPAVDLAIKKTAMPGIITGEFDVDKAVEAVQKAAEEYAASTAK
jgi:raffinose/stachyose/melibiose transport system substrate-binding protein